MKKLIDTTHYRQLITDLKWKPGTIKVYEYYILLKQLLKEIDDKGLNLK